MSNSPTDTQLIELAHTVLTTEADALNRLRDDLGDEFAQAARVIFESNGHCIVSGIGKSGHVGRKIAATLSSTGTPSFFIHPTEASHGDLGMIRSDCCVLAISHSGETREMRDLIVHCNSQNIPIIAITHGRNSFLAKHAKIIVPLIDAPEACPNGLAPTTSTTMTLALGDALAVTVMHLRGFSREDFGARHPGGRLGLQLQKVSDYLVENTDTVPAARADAPGREVIQIITEGRQGCIAVIADNGNFVGMITDGDLRRAMGQDFFEQTAKDMMTSDPVTAAPNQRMSELIEIMVSRRITNLCVVEDQKPVGMVHLKDLMQKGYF